MPRRAPEVRLLADPGSENCIYLQLILAEQFGDALKMQRARLAEPRSRSRKSALGERVAATAFLRTVAQSPRKAKGNADSMCSIVENFRRRQAVYRVATIDSSSRVFCRGSRIPM